MRFFVTNVNAIMTVDKANVESSYYERQQTGIISKEEKVLKSYMFNDNPLWSPEERNRRLNEFVQENSGLIGTGNTILILNDNGTLTEYYSGIEAIPVNSQYQPTQGSSIGSASYYSINADADETKLYVPNMWLREIDKENSLAVIEKLFADKKIDIENQIIKPLQNRDGLAKKRGASYEYDDSISRDTSYEDDYSMYYSM